MKPKGLKHGLCLLSLLSFMGKSLANLPVFDWTNWFESVKQTLEQVQQSKTQLNQYETMLKNSQRLDAYTWDQASSTMDNLLRSVDTLSQYKQQAGSLDAYLSHYQDQTHYQGSPCFRGPCTQEQWQSLQSQEAYSSLAQKRANDAQLRAIEQEQIHLKADALQLERLQKQAQGASGQMAAIQAANQLASHENYQLMQIRALMLAEQNAEATRAAAIANREAMQAAGDERFRSGSFRKSSGKMW